MKTIYFQPNRGLPRRTGQALVPVIFVLLILTVVGVSFGVSASRNAHASGNFVAETQRQYAAQGALNYAMTALAQTSSNGATYGIVPPLPDTDSNGWAPVGDAWVKMDVIDTGAFVNLNSVSSATLQRLPVFRDNPDLADAIVQWRTASQGASQNTSGQTSGSQANGADASTSSSASSASQTDPYQSLPTPYSAKGAPYDTVEELLLVQGMTPTLLYGNAAGTPVSATDAMQNSASGSGSGGSSGAGSGGAYGSRGATRQTTGAARPGGTAAATGGGTGAGGTGAGTGTGGTGTGSGGTAPPAAPEDFSDIYNDSHLVLAQMFTTVSREKNVASDGTARVNVNTATADDLTSKLGLTQDQANGLLRFRNGGNNNGGAQGGQPAGQGNTGNTGGAGNIPRPGAGNGAPPPAGAARPAAPAGPTPRSVSRGHRLSRQAAGARPGGTGNTPPATPGAATTGNAQSNGQTGGTGSASGTGSGATVFKSIADLLESATFTRTVMQQVADKVSIDDKPFRENVVNINTAPPEVLATVPGMTHAILTAITNYRQGGQAFQNLGDFFSLQDLQRTDFQAIIPYITTKTTTYIVHIKVRTPSQQSLYAVSALVEMSDNGPRVLQWQETPRAPGWATWMAAPTLPTPTPGQNAADSGAATSGK